MNEDNISLNFQAKADNIFNSPHHKTLDPIQQTIMFNNLIAQNNNPLASSSMISSVDNFGDLKNNNERQRTNTGMFG